MVSNHFAEGISTRRISRCLLAGEHPENFEALSMARLGASAKSSMATHEQLDTLMVKFETHVDTLIDKEGVEEEEALQKALIADRDQQRA